MADIQRITPCLWFDDQAEEAANLYTAIFDDSRIVSLTRYQAAGQEIHGREPGSVMTVDFELLGQPFTALNGGPVFKFNEAISLVVPCETQQEVDRYWNALSEGGDESAQQCGWLKDRFGVSWQVVPKPLLDMVRDPDSARANRVLEVMMQMKKLDLAKLQAAYAE